MDGADAHAAAPRAGATQRDLRPEARDPRGPRVRRSARRAGPLQAKPASTAKSSWSVTSSSPPARSDIDVSEVLRIVREAITNARLPLRRQSDSGGCRRVDGGSYCASTDQRQRSLAGSRGGGVAADAGTGIIGMHERAEDAGRALRIEGRDPAAARRFHLRCLWLAREHDPESTRCGVGRTPDDGWG